MQYPTLAAALAAFNEGKEVHMGFESIWLDDSGVVHVFCSEGPGPLQYQGVKIRLGPAWRGESRIRQAYSPRFRSRVDWL